MCVHNKEKKNRKPPHLYRILKNIEKKNNTIWSRRNVMYESNEFGGLEKQINKQKAVKNPIAIEK